MHVFFSIHVLFFLYGMDGVTTNQNNEKDKKGQDVHKQKKLRKIC